MTSQDEENQSMAFNSLLRDQSTVKYENESEEDKMDYES